MHVYIDEWLQDHYFWMFSNTNGFTSKCAMGVSVVQIQMCVCYSNSDGSGDNSSTHRLEVCGPAGGYCVSATDQRCCV